MSRINRAIELLEQGQPIYYTGTGEVSYEGGIKAASTWADYLIFEMEHGLFNLAGLEQFMRGLVAGGPTKSGHRTPPVIATLPTDGTDEATMRANAWMVKQVLARGVHGILLCHAETPGAVRAFVEAARYSFQSIGVGEGLGQGRRGNGGQGSPASIWGISTDDYLQRADVWPLNPDGEIMLGLKIENQRALANAEASAGVPGIAFAEWGPGDMGFSFGYTDRNNDEVVQKMQDARARVKAACDAAGVAFLNGVAPDNVTQMIDEGVKVGAGGQEAAEIGRKYTKRTMPW
jgi:4-hydroxy-2-oxoheptanedioate aldolase